MVLDTTHTRTRATVDKRCSCLWSVLLISALIKCSLQGMLSVLSRHFWNSFTYSAGNNVGLLATNWPTYKARGKGCDRFRFDDGSIKRGGRERNEGKDWTVRGCSSP